MELPDEIWNLIKEFALDWKKTNMKKLDHVFGMMFNCFAKRLFCFV